MSSSKPSKKSFTPSQAVSAPTMLPTRRKAWQPIMPAYVPKDAMAIRNMHLVPPIKKDNMKKESLPGDQREELFKVQFGALLSNSPHAKVADKLSAASVEMPQASTLHAQIAPSIDVEKQGRIKTKVTLLNSQLPKTNGREKPSATTSKIPHPSPTHGQKATSIDLTAGAFADDQDPGLDTDIAAFQSRPEPKTVTNYPFIPERDKVWEAHINNWRARHVIELRIVASEARAKHRVIIRGLNATLAEELQAQKMTHDKSMLESQQQFADFFDKMLKYKDTEIDQLQARSHRELDILESWNNHEKRQLQQKIGTLKEEMGYLQQLNATQPKTLADSRISKKVATDDRGYNSSVSLHYPNNTKRAKDRRFQQPMWTSIETLVQRGGGLPIRKQQYELGLPTPRQTEETSLLIREADWAPQSIAETPPAVLQAPMSAGFEQPKYERGNSNISRTGRPVSMLQTPRSAKTVQEIEHEMIQPKTSYRVPPNTALSPAAAEGVFDLALLYRVPPNTTTSVPNGKREDVLGQIEEAIEKEHDMQEAIDRGAWERQWGPEPEVMDTDCPGAWPKRT